MAFQPDDLRDPAAVARAAGFGNLELIHGTQWVALGFLARGVLADAARLEPSVEGGSARRTGHLRPAA